VTSESAVSEKTMSDENKTGTAVLVGLGVIGAATLACHFLCKTEKIGAVSDEEAAAITVDYMGPGDVLIPDENLEKWLRRHSRWTRRSFNGVDSLVRLFSYHGLDEADRFYKQLVRVSDQYNHHPHVRRYTSGGLFVADVAWSSHDVGGITSRDTQMAERTDALI